jgi:hypothetical protein
MRGERVDLAADPRLRHYLVSRRRKFHVLSDELGQEAGSIEILGAELVLIHTRGDIYRLSGPARVPSEHKWHRLYRRDISGAGGIVAQIITGRDPGATLNGERFVYRRFSRRDQGLVSPADPETLLTLARTKGSKADVFVSIHLIAHNDPAIVIAVTLFLRDKEYRAAYQGKGS